MGSALEEIAALKEATREAHEALKDLNAAFKKADQYRTELRVAVEVAVAERIEPVIKLEVQRLKEATDEAIERATEKTFERFDYLADLMLGADRANKKQGRESLTEILEQKAELNND